MEASTLPLHLPNYFFLLSEIKKKFYIVKLFNSRKVCLGMKPKYVIERELSRFSKLYLLLS